MNISSKSIKNNNKFQLLYISDEEEYDIIIKKEDKKEDIKSNIKEDIKSNIKENIKSIIKEDMINYENNNLINNESENNNLINNKSENNNLLNNESENNNLINNESKNNNLLNNKSENNNLLNNKSENNNLLNNKSENNNLLNNEAENNNLLNNEAENNKYELFTFDKEEKDFIDPIILDNINLYYYFDKNDISYVEKYKKSALKITDKGLYSISKPLDAQWISDQIIKEFNSFKINTIIDGTAGIGGNVISFAKYFKNVVGIELNKVHYNVLKENIQLLDLKNVRIYNDNILTYYEHIQERDKSIFFIDPPWGGRKYKNFKNFILKLGKYYIYEFIEILYKSGFKNIVLKAPLNLNVNLIVQNISFKNIKVIKHVNMMLLMIS